MPKSVIILGTLDTKGTELLFLQSRFAQVGIPTVVIDTGVLGKPLFQPNISREEVAEAANSSLEQLTAAQDRGKGIDAMMLGAVRIVKALHEEGKVGGVISLGGTAGTTIGTYVMRGLPIGVPKIQVSTVASGDTRPYVGEKDILMMYSVVDIAGLNGISRTIIANAASAMIGMVQHASDEEHVEDKTLIGATMFGVTTPCVTKARERLEELGYEVLVFHATGTGGKSMEALIESGYIKGVLDITTTEWCDQLVGGVFAAGDSRLEAAGKRGIPQVVSTGALDMVNFGALETVPDLFKNRILYKHNATVTLMRTTVEENRRLGEIIAGKLNATKGPTALYLPLQGVSLYDRPGHSFYGPEEDQSLFQALRNGVNKEAVDVVELDMAINDEAFALAMAERLHQMMKSIGE